MCSTLISVSEGKGFSLDDSFQPLVISIVYAKLRSSRIACEGIGQLRFVFEIVRVVELHIQGKSHRRLECEKGIPVFTGLNDGDTAVPKIRGTAERPHFRAAHHQR